MANMLDVSETLVKRAQDLRVYQRAFETSLAVHHATLSFPPAEQYALSSQMRRASKSICANLAEGFGKQNYSKAEFGRFIAMSAGSASEMQVWCEYALALGYIDSETHALWQEQYDHIIRMLQRLKESIRPL